MIRRKRYRPACSCPGNSGIITAPPAPKLIPKGRYGISIWTQMLLDKFLFFRASHRLIADWEQRYGIRPWLLESFVDRSRFEGTCYRAANWIDVGQTQGRGKKDRHYRANLPRKQIYLYPLCRDCRTRLTIPSPAQHDLLGSRLEG